VLQRSELVPVRRRQFVRVDTATAALRSAAPIDPGGFRADVDSVLDEDPTPRA
jgi:hypothetical protein